MKKVPKGKLVTVSQMRKYLAEQNNADFTGPNDSRNICKYSCLG